MKYTFARDNTDLIGHLAGVAGVTAIKDISKASFGTRDVFFCLVAFSVLNSGIFSPTKWTCHRRYAFKNAEKTLGC